MNIRCFCCMGDSITSDQVSGIGTMVAHRLNAQEMLNAAFAGAHAEGQHHPLDGGWRRVCDSGGNRCRHRHAEHAGRHLHRHLQQ